MTIEFERFREKQPKNVQPVAGRLFIGEKKTYESDPKPPKKGGKKR